MDVQVWIIHSITKKVNGVREYENLIKRGTLELLDEKRTRIFNRTWN
jgi:hypothetical protein